MSPTCQLTMAGKHAERLTNHSKAEIGLGHSKPFSKACYEHLSGTRGPRTQNENKEALSHLRPALKAWTKAIWSLRRAVHFDALHCGLARTPQGNRE